MARWGVKPRSAERRPPTGKVASGYRRPFVGPGVIKPGTIHNDIFAHEDMLPTLLAAAGVPGRQGTALERHEGWQQDFQGPSRRIQHYRRFGGQNS